MHTSQTNSFLQKNGKAMGILRNEFSWSKVERDVKVSRRYWFHYYGSWEDGTGSLIPEPESLRFKQLHNRFAWIGVRFGFLGNFTST